MFFRLIHKFHEHLEIYYGERLLFRYVYIPRTQTIESPRPYFHPIKTLAGDTLTLFRPNDHRWQHGLSMAIPYLSGENFWGGSTYQHDTGYVQKPNNGQQRHLDWNKMLCDEVQGVHLTEQLVWVTQSGEKWLDETRQISVSQIAPNADYWTLEVQLWLKNRRGEVVEFGSPTSEGRPEAGYGGLHWRGSRDLQNGLLTLFDGQTGKTDGDLMGKSGAWLAYSGLHDGVDRSSTLVFVDSPSNPRYPTKWFTRTEQAAAVSFAFAYDQRYALPPDETLALKYKIIIANGTWTQDKINAVLG